MYHFARYNIESGEILAEFTTNSKDLLPLARPGEAFIEVPEEHARRPATESSDPTPTRLQGTVVNGEFRKIGRVAVHEATLELAADLRDLDGDGVLDAPADGARSGRSRPPPSRRGRRNERPAGLSPWPDGLNPSAVAVIDAARITGRKAASGPP